MFGRTQPGVLVPHGGLQERVPDGPPSSGYWAKLEGREGQVPSEALLPNVRKSCEEDVFVTRQSGGSE